MARLISAAANAPVPAIFGMNFQAVSVGQKLIERRESKAATPMLPALRLLAWQARFEFVDAAIGQMVAALKNQNLLDSTAIIITAKHGQSPIDTNRFFPIPGPFGNERQTAVLNPRVPSPGVRRPPASGSPRTTSPSYG